MKFQSAIRGAEHPYGCQTGSFDAQEHHTEWSSWADFYEEYGDADVDMNLVWRWDWVLPDLNEDPEDREEEHLEVFMVHQRRADYKSHRIKVTKKDESVVYLFLAKHAEVMAKIWAPFVVPT